MSDISNIQAAFYAIVLGLTVALVLISPIWLGPLLGLLAELVIGLVVLIVSVVGEFWDALFGKDGEGIRR